MTHVIPAKAGIQLVKERRAADNTVFVCSPIKAWIPAFAGMTKLSTRVVNQLNTQHPHAFFEGSLIVSPPTMNTPLP